LHVCTHRPLFSDFYAAYNFLAKTQRCLFHLLRDIKEELKVSPEDNALVQLDEGIKEIIQTGEKIKKIKDARQKDEAKEKLENRLKNLAGLDSKNQKTKAFIKRINKYQDNLLRFVDHAEIEYHNNRAERALRHSVIFRKITFGNRTELGAYYFSVMNSSIETARRKNLNTNTNTNIYQFIWLIWTAKPSKLKKFTRELLDTS
jgi:transposase